MEKTYLQASMDFDALDKKLKKFVVCRNELVILAKELGMIAQRDLLTVAIVDEKHNESEARGCESIGLIVGSQCGRDKNGTFRCLCGKCKERGD